MRWIAVHVRGLRPGKEGYSNNKNDNRNERKNIVFIVDFYAQRSNVNVL